MVVSGFPRPARAGFNGSISINSQNPPKVEIGADGVTCYLGEADDLENPSALSAPLSSEMPLSPKVASSKVQAITF